MLTEDIPIRSDTPALKSDYVLGALNNMDGAFIVLDARGRILFLNSYRKEFQSLIRKPVHKGDSIVEAMPAEWRAFGKKVLANVVKSKKLSTVEATGKDENGNRLYFEINCKPIENEGEEVRLLLEVKEVTTQKIFERKHSSAAKELMQLVDQAYAVIVGTDSRGCIVEWNTMCVSVTGYTKAEALTRKFEDLLMDESDRLDSRTVLQGVLENKPMINHELSVRTKANERVTLLVNANPKKNSKGQVVGLMLIGQDITELVDYRRTLEERVKERTNALHESNLLIQEQSQTVQAERKKSEQLLLNILPEEIAQELKTTGKVIPRSYPRATILFADLVGFTAMSKTLSPEMLLRELNYIIVGFDMILERNCMEKIKTIGDGYMAVAGIPAANTTNPADAVRSALQMIDFIARIRKANEASKRPLWSVRIGINTGELIAGVIGKNKFAYDVWGASVNTASRMESAGKPDKINISESTYHFVKNQFACSYRGIIEVKGLGDMQMFFVDNEIKQEPKAMTVHASEQKKIA